MRVRTTHLEVYVSIYDGDLNVKTVPHKETKLLPTYEQIEIGSIPAECAAWIHQSEIRKEKS